MPHNNSEIRILYVGERADKIRSGGDSVNLRNISMLERVPNVSLDFEPLADRVPRLYKLLLWTGRLTPAIQRRIIRRIKEGKYDYVFLNSSLMGRLARRIKQLFPHIKIICCYHNIEKQYARELLRISGWSHWPFYLGAAYNERLMIRFADVHLVLNERDAEVMRREYGRTADIILPVAYADVFDEAKCRKLYRLSDLSEPVYLFVGSAFFANIDGVRWLVRNVVPRVRGRFIIVGRGMDGYKKEFASDRVQVIGYVEDLSTLYYAATAAVFPIFAGGGMKTKTAEALMYGRTVVGTPEAFEGYKLTEGAMYCCHTADEFIQTLNQLADSSRRDCYNIASRQTYIADYSFDAVFHKFKSIFESKLSYN